MLQLRGAFSHLLCRIRNGCRDAALLHYTSRQHYHHGRHLPDALLPPSMPLPHFLAFSTSASAVTRGGADPSASPSPTTTIRPAVLDCLLRSYGFSPDEASMVIQRVGRSKTAGNPESVLSFFRGKGLDDALIRKIVFFQPNLLYAKVEKTLAPKFRLFEEMGFARSDMLKLLSRNNSLLCNSIEKKLIPNISLLREECGISGHRLLTLLQRGPRLFGRSTSSLKEVIERVRELGFCHGSLAFTVALRMADFLGRSTVDKRLAYFRSWGWTEEETLSAVRRDPHILGLSERKLDEKLALLKSLGWTEVETLFAIWRRPVILALSKRNIEESADFFVKEAGSSASILAANPALLVYSTEKRVRPRYNVYRILKLKCLPEGKWSLSTLLSLSERKFLGKVILKYKDRFPELSEAYGTRSKE